MTQGRFHFSYLCRSICSVVLQMKGYWNFGTMLHLNDGQFNKPDVTPTSKNKKTHASIDSNMPLCVEKLDGSTSPCRLNAPSSARRRRSLRSRWSTWPRSSQSPKSSAYLRGDSAVWLDVPVRCQHRHLQIRAPHSASQQNGRRDQGQAPVSG